MFGESTPILINFRRVDANDSASEKATTRRIWRIYAFLSGSRRVDAKFGQLASGRRAVICCYNWTITTYNIFCYKFFNGSLPNSFKSIFTKISKIHRHNTRNLNKRLYIKKQKNKSGLKTLSYQASKFWNELPNEIKNKKSIHTFSKSLKKYLLLN